MFLKELDILLQDREVGERGNIVVEVDAIVPHKYIIADSRPAFHRFHEILSGSIVSQRDFAVAIDIAKHNIDIRQRLHMLGRMHRIQIGQRRELLIRETFGQLVQEMDQTAGRASLLLVEYLTFRAATVCMVTVVLADGDHVLSGVRLEDRVDLLCHQFEKLRISQTPLAGFSGTAFAIDKGIIFRMSGTIYVGR